MEENRAHGYRGWKCKSNTSLAQCEHIGHKNTDLPKKFDLEDKIPFFQNIFFLYYLNFSFINPDSNSNARIKVAQSDSFIFSVTKHFIVFIYYC